MEQASDKHSPLRDDEMKHEVEGTLRGDKQSHREEWRQQEPSGEDQPVVGIAGDGTLEGGTPEGMSGDDVERRAELATYLGKEVYPAVGNQLLDRAVAASAPDWVVAELKRLPAGRELVNVAEVWSALGHPVEEHRF